MDSAITSVARPETGPRYKTRKVVAASNLHDQLKNQSTDSTKARSDWLFSFEYFSDVLRLFVPDGMPVYSRLAPNCSIEGFAEAQQDARIKLVYGAVRSMAESYNAGLFSRYLEFISADSEFNPFLFIKTLPLPGPRQSLSPCIPTTNFPSRITLVLDLDETLVHSSVEEIESPDMVFPVSFNGVDYSVFARVRPGYKEFIEFALKHFEVVVFTASQSIYADKLLDILDPENRFFHHRVFRDHCVPVNGNYIKDLRILGREMSRTVIVDNSPHAFGFHVLPINSMMILIL